ncbi:CheW domain-containing protein [Pseudomonas putida]
MTQPQQIGTRPQLALQSYLDGLLQDATEVEDIPDLPLLPVAAASSPVQIEQVVEQQPAQPVAPLVDVHLPAPVLAPPPASGDGRPAWAAEPFECLLFDVAGLTLAVPLVCLGSIYSLAGQELTPLFGQPDWFLGILTCQAGNLKVLDTARWVMPDRYREDFRQGLNYVISVQGYEWGLAVHQVSRSLRLDPSEIKWRSQRGQRPWLAGTVIEHMCALLDVAELAELIASGAVKQMHAKRT